MFYLNNKLKRNYFIVILLLLNITLFGCANNGSMSMRFEVGPNLSDPDFDESLALFNKVYKSQFPWGEVRFAPQAQLRIEGGSGYMNVQRILVMDGGFILASHNMIDDQFHVVIALAYDNLSEFSVNAEDIASGSKRQDLEFFFEFKDGTLAFDGWMFEPEASELLAFVTAKLDEK